MKEVIVNLYEQPIKGKNGSPLERGNLVFENSKLGHTRSLIACEMVKTWKYSRSRSVKEMAARGLFPGVAPFGYWKTTDGELTLDPVESPIISRIFDLCVSGDECLSSMSKSIWIEFGVHLSNRTIRLILEDCFYIGVFVWRRRWYSGVHPILIPRGLFYQAQRTLKSLDSEIPKLGDAMALRAFHDARSISNDCNRTALLQNSLTCAGYVRKGEMMTQKASANNLASPPRCAIYMRCASIEQRCASIEAGSQSIQRHLQSCREAATQNSWIVLDQHVYTDLGFSGNILSGRVALNTLLAAARTNPRPFDHLVVEDVSWLARNLSIVVKILAELKGFGIQVHLASTDLE